MQIKHILIKQTDIQKLYTLWATDNNYNRQLLNMMFDIEIVTDIQEGIKYMELNNIEFANINFSKIDKCAKTIEFICINIKCNLKINTFILSDWSTVFLTYAFFGGIDEDFNNKF